MANIVQVQFKSRYSGNYGGSNYTYLADIPLEVGDLVTVPTANGEGEAKVVRVNVPESEVPEWMHDRLKHITAPATVGDLFGGFFS